MFCYNQSMIQHLGMGRQNCHNQSMVQHLEMGRQNCHNQSIIQHFSHPHPLVLSNVQNSCFNLPPCAVCKHAASGSIYMCQTCYFVLHLSCAQTPRLINHPSDPCNHPLTLLPFPAYPRGAFICKACGLEDNGFSYHCGACTLDLHIHCANMPMSLNHQAHPHTLRLSFWRQMCVTCDICCKAVNQYGWSYECRACDFDAHFSCARNPYAQAANMASLVTSSAIDRTKLSITTQSVKYENGRNGFASCSGGY